MLLSLILVTHFKCPRDDFHASEDPRQKPSTTSHVLSLRQAQSIFAISLNLNHKGSTKAHLEVLGQFLRQLREDVQTQPKMLKSYLDLFYRTRSS